MDNNPIYQQPAAMTGTEFEEWVATVLRKFNFKVAMTGKNDYGVDIVATGVIKGKEHIFNIQCKYWNTTLGNKPIQEVYAGSRFHENGGHPVVLTNNRFTVEARTYALRLGVELISGDDLRLIRECLRTKEKPYYQKKGLLGILIGAAIQDPAYVSKAVKKEKIVLPDTKEKLIEATKTDFEQAEEYIKESAALQQKSAIYQQKAIQLQKEAMLRNLEYG